MSLPRRRMYHLRHHNSELVEDEAVPSFAMSTPDDADRVVFPVLVRLPIRLPATPPSVSVVLAEAAAAATVSMEGAVRGSGGHDCPIKNPLISCVSNIVRVEKQVVFRSKVKWNLFCGERTRKSLLRIIAQRRG